MKKLLAISTLGLSAAALFAVPANAQTSIGQIDFSGRVTLPAGGNTLTFNQGATVDVIPQDPPIPNIFEDLELDGASVSVGTITLPPVGTTDGSATAANPLITNSVSFVATNPGDGSNVQTSPTNISASFEGFWTVVFDPGTPDFPAGTYTFPGFLSVSTQGTGTRTVSFSGEAYDPITFTPIPEPMTILGTGFALAALPGLKKAHKNKKAQ